MCVCTACYETRTVTIHRRTSNENRGAVNAQRGSPPQHAYPILSSCFCPRSPRSPIRWLSLGFSPFTHPMLGRLISPPVDECFVLDHTRQLYELLVVGWLSMDRTRGLAELKAGRTKFSHTQPSRNALLHVSRRLIIAAALACDSRSS
jgi:hypothetical protein